MHYGIDKTHRIKGAESRHYMLYKYKLWNCASLTNKNWKNIVQMCESQVTPVLYIYIHTYIHIYVQVHITGSNMQNEYMKVTLCKNHRSVLLTFIIIQKWVSNLFTWGVSSTSSSPSKYCLSNSAFSPT